MNNNKDKITGIIFIVLALWVVVNNLGLLPSISLFKVVETLILACIIIRGIMGRNFYEIFIPLACLGIIYDKQLNLTSLTPWPLLLASLLLSIGLDMIVGEKNNTPPNQGTGTFN